MPEHIGRPVPLVCFASRDEFLGIAPTILEPTTGLPARSYVDDEIKVFGEFFSQNLTVINNGKTQGNAVVTLKEGDIWHKLKKGEPLAWDTIYHVLGGKPEKQNDDWNMLSLGVATLFTTGILISPAESQKVAFEVNSSPESPEQEGDRTSELLEHKDEREEEHYEIRSFGDLNKKMDDFWFKILDFQDKYDNDDKTQKYFDGSKKSFSLEDTVVSLQVETDDLYELLTENIEIPLISKIFRQPSKYYKEFLEGAKTIEPTDEISIQLLSKTKEIWRLIQKADEELAIYPMRDSKDEIYEVVKSLHFKYILPLWNFTHGSTTYERVQTGVLDYFFPRTPNDDTVKFTTDAREEHAFETVRVGAPTNASMQQSSTAADFGDGHTAHSHSINRVYVPRDSLMDIYFAACAHKTSGIFENGPTYERPSGDTDEMARAEALIRVTSGVSESDAHTIYRGLCPTPQAAERFLCAFNEWYSGESKAAKQFKDDPVVRMVLPESYFNLEDPPLSHNLESAEMYDCGIDFQPLYTIFKFPLRGDLCLFREGHTSPTLPKEYPGHTIFSYARFQDFEKLRIAHELRVKATHYPALLGMANELHLGNPALDSLQGMTKPITESQRKIIEDTLDRISKSIRDIRNIVSFKEASLLSFVEAQETINALEHKLKHDLNLDVSPQVRRAVHRGRIENLKQQASHFSKDYAIDLINQIETSLSPNLSPTLLNFMDDCKKENRPMEALLTDLQFREYLLRNIFALNTVADIIRR